MNPIFGKKDGESSTKISAIRAMVLNTNAKKSDGMKKIFYYGVSKVKHGKNWEALFCL